MIKALNADPQWQVRRDAAEAIGKKGPLAKDAMRELVRILNDRKNQRWEVRRNAALALGKISSQPEATVTALREALREDPEWRVRFYAVIALGNIGSNAKEAISDLVAVLKETTERQDVRGETAAALGKIRSKPEVTIPALRKALKEDPEWVVRNYAAFALGKFGLDAKNAISDLVAVLNKTTERRDVRAEAAAALGIIGSQPEVVVPALVTVLDKDPEWLVRKGAAFALGKIGTDAKGAIPELIKALVDNNEEVQKQAVFALQEISQDLNSKGNTQALAPHSGNC